LAKKYYAVVRGRQNGIFQTWVECKEQVHGFEGAQYKSFESFKEAETFLSKGPYSYSPRSNKDLTESSQKTFKNPEAISQQTNYEAAKLDGFDFQSISVDAACAGNPGPMEYRGVNNLSGEEIFKLSPPILGTNNIGEFLAIVHALAWLHKYKSGMTIYSDSVLAMNWVKAKTVRTKLDRTADTAYTWQLIDRAVNWLKINSYPNRIKKWETKRWGENPADFGRK
jgi:ribonuclease HI